MLFLRLCHQTTGHHRPVLCVCGRCVRAIIARACLMCACALLADESPVVGAEVTAIVDGPNGEEWTIPLYDDGAGACVGLPHAYPVHIPMQPHTHTRTHTHMQFLCVTQQTQSSCFRCTFAVKRHCLFEAFIPHAHIHHTHAHFCRCGCGGERRNLLRVLPLLHSQQQIRSQGEQHAYLTHAHTRTLTLTFTYHVNTCTHTRTHTHTHTLSLSLSLSLPSLVHTHRFHTHM